MPTSFSSNSGVQFSSLGLTSSVSGITATVGLYNNVTGQSTLTHFVPTVPNYVLSSLMNDQLITNTSFQGVSGGIISFNTNSNRLVEISLLGATIGSGSINLSTTASTGTLGVVLRLLKGPSTIINDVQMTLPIDVNAAARVSATSFRWFDLLTTQGAATYILECRCVGASTSAYWVNCQMLAREI